MALKKRALKKLVKAWEVNPCDQNLNPLLSGAATKPDVLSVFKEEDNKSGQVRRPVRRAAMKSSHNNLAEEDLCNVNIDSIEHYMVDDVYNSKIRRNLRTKRSSEGPHLTEMKAILDSSSVASELSVRRARVYFQKLTESSLADDECSDDDSSAFAPPEVYDNGVRK